MHHYNIMVYGLRKVIERVVERTGRYKCMIRDAETASRVIATNALKTGSIHLREMDKVGSNTILRKNDIFEVYGQPEFMGDKATRILVRAMRHNPISGQRMVVFDTTATWCINTPGDREGTSSSS